MKPKRTPPGSTTHSYPRQVVARNELCTSTAFRCLSDPTPPGVLKGKDEVNNLRDFGLLAPSGSLLLSHCFFFSASRPIGLGWFYSGLSGHMAGADKLMTTILYAHKPRAPRPGSPASRASILSRAQGPLSQQTCLQVCNSRICTRELASI